MTDARGGLLVDMDGTVANSLAVMRTVHDRFLEAFDVRGPVESLDESFDEVNGLRLRAAVTRLRERHGLAPEPDELLVRFVAEIGRAYDDVPAMPGAEELLTRARERGLGVALVTSASADLALRWLARSGLEALVDVAVTGDDVGRGKPDPEPYLTALARTSSVAERSLAVEDSRTGARSAVAAGVPTWILDESGDAAEREGWPAVEGFLRGLRDLPLPERAEPRR